MIEQYEASGTSEILEDTVIAERLGVPRLDVQHQLENLDDGQLVELTKSFGPSYAASLTPKGRMALEAAGRENPEPTKRRIGF